MLASSCLAVPMPVCLAVRMEQLGFHVKDFRNVFSFEYFSKICWANTNFIKTWQNNVKTHVSWRLKLSVFFLLRNVYTKVVEKIKAYILGSIIFFNIVIYEIMWKNTVQPDSPLLTIWCMRIACWTNKAINIHSKYVVLIAFLLQRWLHERSSLLRYKYIGCLVKILSFNNQFI
jgi:hypothetical protein